MSVEQLLKQVQAVDLLRFTTAGSVDDGKSTLIGRLLHDAKSIYEDHLATLKKDSQRIGREEIDFSLITDGLKAEREQGITIDVAYRHFSTPRRRFIIADTPGHEQYTRNMVTGASTANLAIVLIDARNGVLTQSKRHGFIASLLGIPHIVVAVNKMDLVDYSQEVYESICDEYIAFSAKLSVKDLTFIPISALCGDNVVQRSTNMPWYDDSPLLAHLENVHIAGDHNLIDMRFPVQYVLRPYDGFRGYCGTVASGVIRVGDQIVVLPSGKSSKVQRILADNEELEYAFPPQAVTVLLEDEIDISRGDMLAHPQNIPWVANELEAIMIWMSEDAMQLNRPYLIKQTTNTVRGHFSQLHYKIDPNTLHRLNTDTIGLNDIARITMNLYKPIFCDEYLRNRLTGSFIIIDAITNFTVAAGMVIDRSHRYDTICSVGEPNISDKNITKHKGSVSPIQREILLKHKPVTIWLTGLSGSGKSTIAYALEKQLIDADHACFVLDGDNIRHGLNSNLGFNPEDRCENIRRVAEVAKLFNDAGLIVIASFISPFAKDRQHAMEIIGEDKFVEIFVDAPIDVCESRDPKGLYVKARSGSIVDFTGISSPYEAPTEPDVHIHSDVITIEEAVSQVMTYLGKQDIFIS